MVRFSLACAVAERGAAPFRTVISHGLTVDEQGRKMSKSLGNSEDAADVVAPIGADVLRLVYASLDYATDIALGDTVYTAVAESYRKIRNTCRYMLGNLPDFDPARDASAGDGCPSSTASSWRAWNGSKPTSAAPSTTYDFQAAYHAILNFVVVDLSSLYIDVARDRLYCAAAASLERRSAQTAMYHMLDALVRMLAPLMPFTADEIYSHMPGERAASVHLLTLAPPIAEWRDAELEARWEHLLKVRAEALKLLETMRQAGTIGAPLEAEVEFGAVGTDDGGMAEALDASSRRAQGSVPRFGASRSSTRAEAEDLRHMANGAESFCFDGVYGRVSADPPLVVLGRRAPGRKCQRCWMYFDDDSGSDLDPRCRAVVRALSA